MTKTKSAKVRVYPVEHSGIGWRPYIDGVPATVTDCTPARGEFLVSTGAFSYEPPAAAIEPQGPATAEPAAPPEE